MLPVAPTPSGRVCTRFNNKLPQFVSPVPDPQAVDALSLSWEGGEVTGLPVQQDHTDCTRVAQHAIVLKPSGYIQSDPTVPAQYAQSADSTNQA